MRSLTALLMPFFLCCGDYVAFNTAQCENSMGDVLAERWIAGPTFGNNTYQPLDQFCGTQASVNLVPYGSMWLTHSVNQPGQSAIAATFQPNCSAGELWVGSGVTDTLRSKAPMSTVSLTYQVKTSGYTTYYIVMSASDTACSIILKNVSVSYVR